MTIVRRGLAGLLVVILLVLIALLVWEPLSAAGYEAPPPRDYNVVIRRDNFGVPHIYGRTDADVAYGTAWAHAEDDFTTLQDVLLQVRGRYGTIAGAEGAAFDYVYHLLGARETATSQYETRLSAETRAVVEAYAAGLNAFARANPGEIKRAGMFPVNGIDVVTGFVLRSPFFYGLDGVVSPLVRGELPPRPPAGGVDDRGSNAFAVSSGASADGVTRLLINSHQPWTGAVAWYELRVKSEEGLDFAGALFPGSPVPLLGHNRALGWANTVNRPDLIDTYRLVLDDSGKRYRLGDEWLPLEKKRIWLRIGFGPFTLPVPRTVYRSVHGPAVINDLGAFAVRYGGIDDARAIEQYYRLTKARDFAEWRAAMAMQAIAGTNFVYADRDGNIGLFYNGSFPDRAEGYDWAGILPGEDPRALWNAYVAPQEIPALVNPSSGIVYNANNQPWQASLPEDDLDPAAFSPLLGVEIRTTNRSLRIGELLARDEDGKFSREELLAIKFDKGYSRNPGGWPAQWMKLLLAVDPGDDERLAAAQRMLARWDWTLDGAGTSDALAAYVMQDGARSGYRGQGFPAAEATLRRATRKLTEHFGRLDPPLQAVMRVRRGNVDVGTTGGPEALRAIYYDEDPDGRLRGDIGDSFIMLVEWDGDGVSSRSVHQFGTAVERPGSPHYNSQAVLFANEMWKPVHLNAAALTRHLEESYRPGAARR